MDLAFTSESYGVDDLRWLGSREGTDTAQSVTLTSANFATVITDDDMIPSGTPLAVDGATGRYTLWATTADLAGFLLAPLKVRDTSRNVAGAMIDRGRIVRDFLPVAPDAAGEGTAPRFVFVDA